MLLVQMIYVIYVCKLYIICVPKVLKCLKRVVDYTLETRHQNIFLENSYPLLKPRKRRPAVPPGMNHDRVGGQVWGF